MTANGMQREIRHPQFVMLALSEKRLRIHRVRLSQHDFEKDVGVQQQLHEPVRSDKRILCCNSTDEVAGRSSARMPAHENVGWPFGRAPCLRKRYSAKSCTSFWISAGN